MKPRPSLIGNAVRLRREDWSLGGWGGGGGGGWRGGGDSDQTALEEITSAYDIL